MRINVIPPKLLADQHIIAEWNEHHMLTEMLDRSRNARSDEEIMSIIPETYRLGKGHGFFFYNKLAWINARRQQLFEEMKRRGFMVTEAYMYLRARHIPDEFFGQWEVTPEAIQINLERIRQRIAMKPTWYIYCHKGVADWDDFYKELIAA